MAFLTIKTTKQPLKRWDVLLKHKMTDLEKELSKMSVYSPGFLTFISPWIVSLWELQRVSGIKTWGEQSAGVLADIYNYSRDILHISVYIRGRSERVKGTVLCQHDPFIHIPVFHLSLLQWSLCALPVDHTEGDALRFRGKCPGDGGARTAHGDGDGAVTAGLNEKLSGAVPKPGDVIHCEVDREPTAQNIKQDTRILFRRFRAARKGAVAKKLHIFYPISSPKIATTIS